LTPRRFGLFYGGPRPDDRVRGVSPRVEGDDLRAWFRLVRLPNALISCASVLVAGFLARGEWFFPGWGWAMAGSGLLLIAGNVDNDVADIESDRVNRPERPLPSGEITIRQAQAVAAVLAVGGLSASWPLGVPAFSIAVGAAGLLWLYNHQLKRRPLVGNLAVAGLTGLLFLYIAVVTRRWEGLVPTALFAFWVHLARELVKDLEDMEGDAVQGARTLALLRPELTRVLAIVALGMALATGWVTPLIVRWGHTTTPALGIGVTVILASPIGHVISARMKRDWTETSKRLKLTMIAGLVILVLSRW
jgi:geranylgeranylglycerol-phosphate geranylgeranyltransferase